MEFDDLYQGNRKRSFSASKKLRFCCIFLIVAALTAFVIWKLVPSSAENNKGKTKQPDAVLQKKTPEIQHEKEASGEQNQTPQPADSDKRQTRELPEAASAGLVSEKKQVPVRPEERREHEQKGIAGQNDLPADRDKPVIPPEPRLETTSTRRLAALENLLKEKKFAAASSDAEQFLATLTEGSELYRKVLKCLTQANWQRFLTRDTADGFAFHYTVVHGDQLGVIARKNRTTVAAVMKSNNLKRSNLIRIGQKLTLLPGKWRIRVSKNKRLLLLLRNDRIFAGFDIGIGRAGKTPTADFILSERLKHPVYRTADGRIYKHGEPGNQLGDYFLKLASVKNPGRPLGGYGIHGTPDESSVTRSLSNGCIRMLNSDVEKLYFLVPAGTPVSICD